MFLLSWADDTVSFARTKTTVCPGAVDVVTVSDRAVVAPPRPPSSVALRWRMIGMNLATSSAFVPAQSCIANRVAPAFFTIQFLTLANELV